MLFIIVYIVSNTKEVIELCTFIHKQVLDGRSVNSALKMTDKDRKTLDRFKHIYYLQIQNNDRLKEVSGRVCYNSQLEESRHFIDNIHILFSTAY